MKDELDYQTYKRIRDAVRSEQFRKRSAAAKRGHQTRLQNRKLREWQIVRQTFVYNYCDKQGTK